MWYCILLLTELSDENFSDFVTAMGKLVDTNLSYSYTTAVAKEKEYEKDNWLFLVRGARKNKKKLGGSERKK